jgi:hypothetical protein
VNLISSFSSTATSIKKRQEQAGKPELGSPLDLLAFSLFYLRNWAQISKIAYPTPGKSTGHPFLVVPMAQ